MSTETSNAVVPTTPLLSEDQLTEIKSFDDALATLAEAGIAVTSASDYGDGFEVMDKVNFVNQKFILIDYKIVPGEKSDYGSAFVAVRLVTTDGRKGIITDGSTGVRDQILNLAKKGVTGGVMCERGLTASEYTYTDDKGKTTPAKTYYIHGM